MGASFLSLRRRRGRAHVCVDDAITVGIIPVFVSAARRLLPQHIQVYGYFLQSQFAANAPAEDAPLCGSQDHLLTIDSVDGACLFRKWLCQKTVGQAALD